MTQISVRRILLGSPLHTGAAPHQRLSKLIALPVFASDCLSSVAYATQETMIALVIAGVGSAAMGLTIPLAASIAVLLMILTVSYNQTIHAYPNGGGAFIVARDNLGALAAKIAAVALLVDYILTVAVSVSAGIDAILSQYLFLDHLPIRLALNVSATLFIMLMNLRGVKESGVLFAIPTYGFILSLLTLIGIGCWQVATGGFHHLALAPAHVYPAIKTLTIFVILRAFASGCTAVTGVEAVSNGIPAFRPPESRNAAVTMRWMAILLGTMFIGVSYLAQHLSAMHRIMLSDSGETVISQLGDVIVGRSPFHSVVQWFTFLVLILAANTSFADFPRLSSLAAHDRYLPRWFTVVGDRLVFQNGIIVLAVLAIILEVAFKGSTDGLIPLYAIGVFVAFTLSQAGMVMRWRRLKSPGWIWRVGINGIGALLTALVALVFAFVKFTEGAWIVLILMPALVLLLTRVERHYAYVRDRLRLRNYEHPGPRPNTAVLLVARWDESTRAAIEYCKVAFKEVHALNLRQASPESAALPVWWRQCAGDVPLIVDSVSQDWLPAIRSEINRLREPCPSLVVTVVLPRFLHPTSGNLADRIVTWRLKWQLLHEPGVAVADASVLNLPERSNGACSSQYAGSGGAMTRALSGNGAESKRVAAEDAASTQVSAARTPLFRPEEHTVLLLTPGMHRGILETIDYARQLGSDIRALHIEMEPDKTEDLRVAWEKWAGDLPLIIMETPYRQLREPLVRYVRVTASQARTRVLTVLLPEFVARKWWNKILHNQSGLLLKFALRGQPNVVVINYRYFLE